MGGNCRVQQQFEVGARLLGPVEIRDFGDQLVEIEARKMHVGSARILAEGVDHLLHRIHLRDDGGGCALEDLGVLGIHLPQELAPHALGGQLNRRQRVFDFMRQAARHFAPCRVALRLQQGRDVVEHQHHAGRAAQVVGQAPCRRT